jgi:hypothetical protein
MKKIWLLFIILSIQLSAQAAPMCEYVFKEELQISKMRFSYKERDVLGAEDATPWKSQIWDLYVKTYSHLGELMFKNPEMMLAEFPQAVIIAKDGNLEGFLLLRPTPHGMKLGLVSTLPTTINFVVTKKVIEHFSNSSGWFAEVSGATYKFLNSLGTLHFVKIAKVQEILNGKQVKPVTDSSHEHWTADTDGFVYSRDLPLGGKQVPVEKVMIGYPL